MEEEITYPEGEEIEEEDELAEELIADMEPEEQAEYDAGTVETNSFEVRVFFHTGAATTVRAGYEDNLLNLRDALAKDGRRTHGNTVLLNGVRIDPQYEGEKYLSPGDIVTFSGTVKGG